LYSQYGKQENDKKILDLKALGFDKLLGGGQIKNAYSIKIDQFTSKAEDKVKNSGGELVKKEKKINQFTSKAEDKVKNSGEELVKKNG
jgi:large subunit ribosomal protein L15